MAALVGNCLLAYLAVCVPLSVHAAYYPSHWYLKQNCGTIRAFSTSLVLGYSYQRYSSLPRNWDCPFTLRTQDHSRGVQVRFRYLDTSRSGDCSQARLIVSDSQGPLTPSSGVCGKSTPDVLRTADHTVYISFSTGGSFFNSGDFELLVTDFSYAKDGVCGRDDFQCGNGICISADLKCNGYNDCDDSSDEVEGCGLTAGVIIGIALGVICFLILICLAGVLCRRRRQKYIRIEQTVQPYTPPQYASAPYSSAKEVQTGYPPPHPPPPYPGNNY